MTKVTIDLPESIKVALGDTGKFTTVAVGDIAKSHPDVIKFAALAGFMGAINNVSRGKDDNGKANSDNVWAAMRDKRCAPWLTGTWATVERGESQYSGMREAFLAECIAKLGMTSKQVDALIKEKVLERLGKDSAATFSNYLEATALEYVEAGQFTDKEAARDALESYYGEAAEKAAAARAKVQAKVVVPMLDLAAFKKPDSK